MNKTLETIIEIVGAMPIGLVGFVNGTQYALDQNIIDALKPIAAIDIAALAGFYIRRAKLNPFVYSKKISKFMVLLNGVYAAGFMAGYAVGNAAKSDLISHFIYNPTFHSYINAISQIKDTL